MRGAVCALLVFAPATLVLQAADPPIGISMSGPELQTSRLVEGASVTAGLYQSEVHLQSGATIRMRPGSRGVFYGDHMVLEQGSANVNLRGRYRVLAKQLTVQPQAPSTATIAVLESGSVAVAMFSGSMRVLNGGETLAELQPGRGLEFAFAPQSSSSGQTSPGISPGGGPARGGRGIPVCTAEYPIGIQGKLSEENGDIYITDELTGAKIKLVPPTDERKAKILRDAAKKGLSQLVCGQVFDKAKPDNTGLVLRAGIQVDANPQQGNVRQICGEVTKDADGYWIVDRYTGLRYKIVPGGVCDPDELIKKQDDAKKAKNFDKEHEAWEKKHKEWEEKFEKWKKWYFAYLNWQKEPSGPKKDRAPEQPPKPGPEPVEPPLPVCVTGKVDLPAKAGELPTITCVDLGKLQGQLGPPAAPAEGGTGAKPIVISTAAVAVTALVISVYVIEEKPPSISPVF